MGIMLLAMLSFGFLVLILSGITVVNLLMGMMASQVRQIGVMKAIGGTRRQVALIYFGQAIMLGIAALALALPMGILGGQILSRFFAALLNFDIISFAVPLWVYLLIVTAALVVPLVAAAYPSGGAARFRSEKRWLILEPRPTFSAPVSSIACSGVSEERRVRSCLPFATALDGACDWR